MFWNEGETRYSMTREACLFFTHSARCGEVQYWKRSQNATCLRVHYGELQFQCRAKTFFFCPKPEKPEKNQQNRAKTGWIILKTKKNLRLLVGMRTRGVQLNAAVMALSAMPPPPPASAPGHLPLPPSQHQQPPSQYSLCMSVLGGRLRGLPVGSRTSWWCRKAPTILSIVRLHGWPPNSLFDFLLSYSLLSLSIQCAP